MHDGPLDRGVEPLKRINAAYDRAMGPRGAAAEQPDPLKTPHLPYLNADQLVRDKVRQRKANEQGPAKALNDAIDAKLRRSNLFGQPALEPIGDPPAAAKPNAPEKTSLPKPRPERRDEAPAPVSEPAKKLERAAKARQAEKHLNEIDASWRAFVEDSGGDEKIPASARALYAGQRRAAQEAADIASGRKPDRGVEVAQAETGVATDADGRSQERSDIIAVGERLNDEHRRAQDAQAEPERRLTFEQRFLAELRKDRKGYAALLEAELARLEEPMAEASAYRDVFYGQDWRGQADMRKPLDESFFSKLRSGYAGPPDGFTEWLAANGDAYGLPDEPFAAFIRLSDPSEESGAREGFAGWLVERRALGEALRDIGIEAGWERIKGVAVDIPLDTVEGLRTLADAALARPETPELEGDGFDPARIAAYWSRMALADAAAAATARFTEETPEAVAGRRAETRDALLAGIDQAVDYLRGVIESGEAPAEAKRALERFVAARKRRLADWRANDAALLGGEIDPAAYKERERRYTRETADDVLLALDAAAAFGGVARRARVLAASDAARQIGASLGRQADDLAAEAAGAHYYIAPDGSRKQPMRQDANSGPYVAVDESLAEFIAKKTPKEGQKGLFTWFDEITEQDLHRIVRISVKDLKDLGLESKTPLSSSIAARIRAASRARRGGDGAHEWFMVASLPYLKRMGIGLERMTSPEFTSPTTMKIWDPAKRDPKAGLYEHRETSDRKAGATPEGRDRRVRAARLYSRMHRELEDGLFLAANAGNPDRAMSILFSVTAKRWLPEGVEGLPSGLQELIRSQGVDTSLARFAEGVSGPAALLKLDPALRKKEFEISKRYLTD